MAWWLMVFTACGDDAVLPTTWVRVDGRRVRVEVADEPGERERGLMFRERLGRSRGMLFVFPRAEPRQFWMRNTRLPLSIAYLDPRGRVLNIADLHPLDETPVPSAGAALYALEMNEGWFERRGVEPGDVVTGLPPAADR